MVYTPRIKGKLMMIMKIRIFNSGGGIDKKFTFIKSLGFNTFVVVAVSKNLGNNKDI